MAILTNNDGILSRPQTIQDDTDADTSSETGGTTAADDDGTTYAALLTPANESGVLGLALVHLEGDTLTVDIRAAGLTPGEIHPQHIHGFPDGEPSSVPTIALDDDLDGFIETAEGSEAFGPILLPLTASGALPPDATSADFPTAGPDGTLEFRQTYTFDLTDPDQAAIFDALSMRLEGRAVEVHGLEVPPGEGEGTGLEVDGEGGYVAALPVAGGILQQVPDDFELDLSNLAALDARFAELNPLG